MKLSSMTAVMILCLAGCATSTKTVNSGSFEPAPWPKQSPEFTSALFSRAGVTVRDMEESLAFYRDVLGISVIVDRKGMYDPRLPQFSGIEPDQTIRLVILRPAMTDGIKFNAGYIALSVITDAQGEPLPPEENVVTSGTEPGSIMLQFVVDDVRPIYAQVQKLGYEIISAPEERDDDTRSELLVRDHNDIRYWITDRYIRPVFLK